MCTYNPAFTFISACQSNKFRFILFGIKLIKCKYGLFHTAFPCTALWNESSGRLVSKLSKKIIHPSSTYSFKSSLLLRFRFKSKVRDSAASSCVYCYKCSCGPRYIGRTTRRLSRQIHVHQLTWLRRLVTKSISSLVCTHLVDSTHANEPNQAFRPIYLAQRK